MAIGSAAGGANRRKSADSPIHRNSPAQIPGAIDPFIGGRNAATSTCHLWCAALSLGVPLPWIEPRIFQVVSAVPDHRAGTGKAIARPLRLTSGRREVMMNALLQEYLPLAIFIGLSLAIGLALLVAPFIVAYRQPDPEKLSAYECGFNAFDDARMKFDVRFYLVAIIFIIFDLEVAFLFPWAITFGQLGAFGFWSMMVFLAVLTVGFIYEWKKGALEWD